MENPMKVQMLLNFDQRMQAYREDRRNFWIKEFSSFALAGIVVTFGMMFVVSKIPGVEFPMNSNWWQFAFLFWLGAMVIPIKMMHPKRPSPDDVLRDQALRRQFGMDDTVTPTQLASNVSAHAHLNQLRQSELSVGAAFQRGERVDKAPGLAEGGQSISSHSSGERHPQKGKLDSVSVKTSVNSAESQSDFWTSAAIGAITGDAITGYAVGGSLEGGVTGSTLSDFKGDCDASPSTD